ADPLEGRRAGAGLDAAQEVDERQARAACPSGQDPRIVGARAHRSPPAGPTAPATALTLSAAAAAAPSPAAAPRIPKSSTRTRRGSKGSGKNTAIVRSPITLRQSASAVWIAK